MEVLADRHFRAAISTIGGMHEAVHEFIRITTPSLPSIRGVLKQRYNALEMGPHLPLAVQIMGSDPCAMRLASAELVHNHAAPRIDLNCGCPSRRVNGRGAGASLLKEPEHLYQVVRAMAEGAEGRCIVSVKMRSGYDGVALFEDNVVAAMEGGAEMVTVHPRTKTQGYRGEADWGLIERAKRLCGKRIQIVGNGDVGSAEDALRMLEHTNCDHVMIGRGAVRNPWIFWEIQERLWGVREGRLQRCLETETAFYERYMDSGEGIDDSSSSKLHKMKIGRFKMLLAFSSVISEEDKNRLLASDGGGDARRYLEQVLGVIRKYYST